MYRRLISAALLAALLVALTGGGASAADSGNDDVGTSPGAATGNARSGLSLQLRTTRTASITAGDTAWIVLSWEGLADVTDFALTATGQSGVEIAYPANTGNHTSFSQGSGLAEGATDWTALQVTVPDSSNGNQWLTLSFSWTAFGETKQATTRIRVPVAKYRGNDLEIVDRTTTVDDDGNVWVEIAYRGLAPRLEGFTVRVPGSERAEVYYPREDHSSLSADDILEDGETDVARFRVGADSVDAVSTLVATATYAVGGRTRTIDQPLTFLRS